MSAVAKSVSPSPRYGSVAELAKFAGLSPKTIRRLVEAGDIRGLKVGRRLLIPFEDMDRYILGRADRSNPGRQPVMATIRSNAKGPAIAEAPYVPPIGAGGVGPPQPGRHGASRRLGVGGGRTRPA